MKFKLSENSLILPNDEISINVEIDNLYSTIIKSGVYKNEAEVIKQNLEADGANRDNR